ncbi:MAG: hypothetical protein V4612_04820 [Pseudomonadota bacterium]
MMKNSFFLLMILLISGCKMFTGSELYFFTGTNYKVPDGTPSFQTGFRDGCENGIYSRANVFYRTRYHGYKYHPSLIDNPEYKFGVGRGYSYCFSMNTAGVHTGGFDQFIYGRGTPFDMGRGNIDSTVNYEQGSWNNPFNISGGGVDGVWGAVQAPKGFSTFGSHPLYGTPSSGQVFGW